MEQRETPPQEHLTLLKQHVLRYRAQYELINAARAVEELREREEDELRAHQLLQATLLERKRSVDLEVLIPRLARRAVEERVVQEMLRNRRSPLWTLNFIWVVQQICRVERWRYGQPAAPTQSLDELLSTLLQAVPEARRKMVTAASSEICRRIARALATFHFDSNFDTWRSKIVENVLRDVHAEERRWDVRNVVFSDLTQPTDDPFETAENTTQFDPPSADLTLDEQLAQQELQLLLDECATLTFTEQPTIEAIIDLRVREVPPREVAESLNIPRDLVYIVYDAWKERMRQLLEQHDPAYKQRRQPKKQRKPRQPKPPASSG